MQNLFISCEHASNQVPEQLQEIFAQKKRILRSHRAYDKGALNAAERIAEVTGATLISGRCTRLAVDLNRGDSNPKRFSHYSRNLDGAVLQIIQEQWYQPYRIAIFTTITSIIKRHSHALHLSIHTFTPVLDGVKRNADIGILYDPSRTHERAFASQMKTTLAQIAPDLKVRFNYPYKGVSDGMTSWLRKHFTGDQYSGLEIEFNQRLLRKTTEWDTCLQAFIAAFEKVRWI